MLTNTTQSKSALTYRIEGKQQLEAGELEQAFISYSKAIELESPQPPWVYKHLRKILIKTGQREKAGEVSCILGEVLLKQQQVDKALTSFQKAVELNPNLAEAYLNLGNIFRSIGKIKESIDSYLQVTEIDPEIIIAYGRLFAILRHYPVSTEQLEKITQHHRKIEQIVQGEVLTHVKLVLADVLSKQANIAEAIDCHQTIIKEKNLKSKAELIAQHKTVIQRKKPDFLIAGFAKCGTSSLYKYMIKHPYILHTARKEINFFNNENLFKLGTDWYLSNFTPIPHDSNYICGEATPVYILSSLARERIQQFLPNVKIIIILRNPTDRAISQHYFGVKRGRVKNLENYINCAIDKLKNITNLKDKFEKYNGCIPKAGDISASLYVYFIERWLEVFPRENFLFLKTEDLGQNPVATMDRVFEFLGLPKYQLNEYSRENSNSYDPIDHSLRQKLSEFFLPYNQKLEQLIGIECDWR